MCNWIILGISNIGNDLLKEVVTMLLVVGLLAYISLLIYSLSNEGKKRFSFKGIIRNSLFLLSYVSLGAPNIVVDRLDLEPLSFGVMAVLLILGVLLIVLISNVTNKTRYAITSGFVYSLMISIILISVLPQKTISFKDYDSVEIANLVLERNSLDSTAQLNLCNHILTNEEDLVQLLWKRIVAEATKDLDDSIKTYRFEERERIFIQNLRYTEGDTISFDWNKLNKITSKDDYFLRRFIFRKYLIYTRYH